MGFLLKIAIFEQKYKMIYPIDILQKNRTLVLKVTNELTLAQFNKIPEGFGNNIVWNIAHLVVTHQILCYKFSGLPMNVSNEMVEKYMKGAAPKDDVSQSELDEIIHLFKELPIQFEKDYTAKVFKEYESYTTSVDVTLTDIDSATAFNNLHEGIHLGVILALKKLV